MSEKSDKQFEKLNGLLLSKPCLVCGNQGYTRERANYRLYAVADGRESFRNVIRYVCGNCGHVLFFDSAEQGI